MSITKADLDQALETAITGSEGRIKTELRAQIEQAATESEHRIKTELRAEMATGEARLHAHIEQAAKLHRAPRRPR